jgi:endonuclease/exonuclease/phosphatase family metal-dependent hydrolase
MPSRRTPSLPGVVRLWPFLIAVALSAVAASRAAAQIPTDTAAHWTLDEMTGTIAGDTSGNGNDGTLTNGPIWTAGKINGALLFDGIDDNVTVAVPAPSLRPAGTYAISAWVRYTATDTSGGDVATMGDSYALRVQPTGDVKTYFYNGTTWNAVISTGVNTKDGAWHHLVGQYTGSSVQVYVDGVLKNQAAFTGSIVYTLGSSFFLGQHGNGGVHHNFNGTIDQVRVYGRALTAAEISALAAEAPAGSVTFKVLTWNSHKCRRTDNVVDCNRIADWILSTGTDVALLSAVHTATDAAAIKARLGGTWDYFFDIAGTEGQAIFSRYPIGDSASNPVFVSGSENQIIVKATVTIGGRAVNFFAIDQDDLSASVRLTQATAFSNWAAGFPEPRFIGGDFNEESGSAMTQWLSTALYNDDWVIGSPETLYSGNTTGRTRRSRLDHVLSSQGASGIVVGEAKVWDARDFSTSCSQVVSLLCKPPTECSNACDSSFVDDHNVRPTDHIPLTVIITLN